MGEVRSASLVNLEEGGGLFIGEDKDVALSSVKFIRHTLKKRDGTVVGKGKEQCYLYYKQTVENPDDDAHKDSEQYYAVGDIEHFQPSADNKTPSAEGGYVVLTGTFDGIWNKSNYGVWISELLSIGLDPGLISEGKGISNLDGIRLHMVGKAMPKSKNAPADQKEFKLLIPSAINALPGEKKGTAAKPAAATTSKSAQTSTAPAPTVANNGEVEAKATEYVKKALANAGGSLGKKALGQAIFKLASDGKEGKLVAPITKKSNEDAFLNSLADSGIMFSPETGEVVAVG